MSILKKVLILSSGLFLLQQANAHAPYVAPLNFQTYNLNTSIIAGFYDNPFASEVALKNFKFIKITPDGTKSDIADQEWAQTQTLSQYSLDNKVDGTYRIRGVREGKETRYAKIGQQWKLIVASNPTQDPLPDHVILEKDLPKKATIKTVKTTDIVETFVSRKSLSEPAVKAQQAGFNVEFSTHPSQFKTKQNIQLKVTNQGQAVANAKVEILAQTTNFSHESTVQSLKTDQNGILTFQIDKANQYLMIIEDQESFDLKKNELNRYRYTLSFNVGE